MNDIMLDVHLVVFSLHEDALQVLLTQTGTKRWELPGSPVKAGEALEIAALRAVAGQIDQRQAYLEQLYTYGGPGRSPRRLISVVYFALVPANALHPPPRASRAGVPVAGPARWFPVENMPPLAHDHKEIAAYALRRLRYKLEYSAVGFQLLPDEFTLSELQHTYEITLGEKLDKRNFRRRILEAGIIEETARHRTGEGRPARLFRYRPDAVAEVKARRLFP